MWLSEQKKVAGGAMNTMLSCNQAMGNFTRQMITHMVMCQGPKLPVVFSMMSNVATIDKKIKI